MAILSVLSRSTGPVVLTGSSLLNLLKDQELEGTNLMGGRQSKPVSHDSGRRLVYGSHVLHEATMYYPMRSLRSARSLYIPIFFSRVIQLHEEVHILNIPQVHAYPQP